MDIAIVLNVLELTTLVSVPSSNTKLYTSMGSSPKAAILRNTQGKWMAVRAEEDLGKC